MSVWDKFLDFMKLNDTDEYDDDDDFFDDDYDDVPMAKKKKTPARGGRTSRSSSYDDFDDYDEQPKRATGGRASSSARSKVTPLRTAPSRASDMEVCVVRPTTLEGTREMVEMLLSGRTVILNLEGLDLEVAQRIIDFSSGGTFSLGGNLQKISNYIFLVTPANVEISGDSQDLLIDAANASFASTSTRKRY